MAEHRKVGTGLYNNISEAVHNAIRRMRKKYEQRGALRAAVQVSDEQLNRREGIPGMGGFHCAFLQNEKLDYTQLRFSTRITGLSTFKIMVFVHNALASKCFLYNSTDP